MADDTPTAPVAQDHLLRLRRAVNLATEGSFSDALAMLQGAEPGAFGEFEKALGDFIADFKLAIDQSAQMVDEFSASRRELEKKIETIEEQNATIQRLSAPIIDVWDDIVTVPLSGMPESRHTQEIAERLLHRIHSTRIRWVILDLTGTEHIDTMLADQLIKLSSAVRLMGVECLVTGLSASAAQTLVSLGTSLEGLRAIATVKDGLKYCFGRQRSAPGFATAAPGRASGQHPTRR